MKYRIRCENYVNLAKFGFEFLILPIEKINPNIEKHGVIIEPPRFTFNEKKVYSQLKKLRAAGFSRIMCNNIAYLKMGKDLGFKLHGDFGLNVTNSYTADFLFEDGLESLTLSLELTARQIEGIAEKFPRNSCGIIAYGNLPIMLTAYDIPKNSLTDRTNRKFEIMPKNGTKTVLNSVPIYLADKLENFKRIKFLTLYFNNESENEIENVIKNYRNAAPPPKKFTRGLYFRGVE